MCFYTYVYLCTNRATLFECFNAGMGSLLDPVMLSTRATGLSPQQFSTEPLECYDRVHQERSSLYTKIGSKGMYLNFIC